MEIKEQLYKDAIEMIKNGNYLGAYNNLRICKDYKDSKEMLFDFKIVCDKKICKKYCGIEKIYSTTTYEYDENSKLIAKIYITQDDETKTVYTYDKDGRLLSESTYRFDEKLYESEYTYDENGNRINDYHTLKIIYDKNENKIFEIRFGYHSDIIKKCEYKYDQYGNKILSLEYDGNGKLIHKSTTEYQYDSNDNIIKASCYFGVEEKELFNQRRYEYEYNKYGAKILETVYYSEGIGMAKCNALAGEGFSYEEKEVIEHIFEYDYDEYGNVTLIKECKFDKTISSKTEFEYINPRVVYKPQK